MWRHPFPGPGLGVRILCSSEEVERNYDPADFYVLPLQSVGVQGDGRTYRHPALLNVDPKLDHEKAVTDLVNSNAEVNRGVIMVGKSFSGEVEKVKVKVCDLSEDRIKLLQEADSIVTQALYEMNLYESVWQFPVVLAPISFNGMGEESIILRPINSIDAMSASAAKLPWEFYEKVCSEILKEPRISAVLLDYTNKPPGTIEWE